MAKHKDDGKFVVVQDGQRVSGQLHEKKEEAESEADALKKKQSVMEGKKPTPQPTVKVNLYG